MEGNALLIEKKTVLNHQKIEEEKYVLLEQSSNKMPVKTDGLSK
jgi:hypothetical protein